MLEISHTPTKEGWLYLGASNCPRTCGLHDIYSRKVVGWSMYSFTHTSCKLQVY